MSDTYRKPAKAAKRHPVTKGEAERRQRTETLHRATPSPGLARKLSRAPRFGD